MPVQRGIVYAAPADPDVDAWLVLTNDDWNEHLGTVGAVPLGRAETFDHVPPHSARVSIRGADHWAVLGALASIEREADVGASIGAVTEAETKSIEEGFADLLDLRSVLQEPPRAPRPARGARSPMWGDVYYGPSPGEGRQAERKRYVVVSRNEWNAAMPQVICVRTTTSPRRGGPGFPAIQGGAARACCGQASAVMTAALDLRRRPAPSRLGLGDMVTIVRDIAETFELPAVQSPG